MLLVLYTVLLLLLLPATPFEWDEVLFLRSLDHIDVLNHSPHPPGFPAYVFLARLIRLVVGDPLRALQLASLMAAATGLWATARLVMTLGGERSAGLVAAALLACQPEYAFMATVGTSDVPGAAATVGAAVALIAAARRTSFLIPAGVVTAVALGVRPQVLPALAPALLWAGVAAWRRRRLPTLVLAAACGAVTLAALWLPVVLLTGPPRYLQAIHQHLHYMATVTSRFRLPWAPPARVLEAWLLGSSGSVALSLGAWALAIAGCIGWVRAGRRTLVVVAAASALLYLLFALFAMEYTVALRYALPALPFLAVLASGVSATPGRWRLAGLALAGAWCCAAALWAAPAFPVRTGPAPVWQALTWIRDNCPPAETEVAFDSLIGPHARYVLEPLGYHLRRVTPGEPVPTSARPPRQLLFVSSRRAAPGTVVFHAEWDAPRLLRLAWNRYGSCTVYRVTAATRLLPEAERLPAHRRRDRSLCSPGGRLSSLARKCPSPGSAGDSAGSNRSLWTSHWKEPDHA